MKELLVEFLKTILKEAPANKKPANARYQRGGSWYSDPQFTSYVGRFIDGEWRSAEETGGDKKVTKPEKSQSAEPSAQGTTSNSYAPPAGEKSAPTNKPNPNAVPIVKTKELDQSINSVEIFNTDPKFVNDGVPDAEFSANSNVETATNQLSVDDIQQYFVDENGATTFPAKYIKVLSRLLSTKPGSLTITDFTDASGAGTLASTTGELLTLMGISTKDDQKAAEFFKMVEAHVKKNTKIKESIIDPAWVKSAQKVRAVLNRRYDAIYGEGNWELSGAAWDIESEVEALGLPDYKDNKGFSTDIYLQITVDGKIVLDEISLKKDLKANLLNATSGRISDIMVYGAASPEDKIIYEDLNTRLDALAGVKTSAAKKERDILNEQRTAIIEKYNADVPDDVKVAKVTLRQKELYDEYVSSSINEIREFGPRWKTLDKTEKIRIIREVVANMNQKESYGAEVAIHLDKLSKADFSTPDEFATAMKRIIGTNDISRKQKFMLSMMYGIRSVSKNETQAGAYVDNIIKNAHNHSKAVRDFLLNDQRARKGLLLSIRDAFPLKALFEGEETMALGDVVVDRKILTNMFGTEDFSQVEQKLTVRDEPPPPSIVYRAIGVEDIPIAEIVSRPDGIGYGGSWKLEMSIHKAFGDILKKQNNITYPL
jgi:hypothetical protein